MEDLIQIKKLPKSEIEISITIPWKEVKDLYNLLLERAISQTQLKGFRKGKAPKKLVEEKIDKNKIYSQVTQDLILKYYQDAIVKYNLKPIVNPKVEIISSEENTDWKIKILICEEPEVKLGNYKEEISKLNKSGRIWVPGKSENQQKEKADQKEEKLQKIINWILENAKIEFSQLLIEQEVTRKLSQLIEETQKLGITLEQYLVSTGKTVEIIREEYKNQVIESWKLELALNKISDEQNIVVENNEIEELIEKAGSEEEKNKLNNQRYLLASLLRRQKTLDFLVNL